MSRWIGVGIPTSLPSVDLSKYDPRTIMSARYSGMLTNAANQLASKFGPQLAQTASQDLSTALGVSPEDVQSVLTTGGNALQALTPIAQDAMAIAESGGNVTWMEAVGVTAAAVALVNPVAGAVVAAVGSFVQGIAGMFGDTSAFFGGGGGPPPSPVDISMFSFVTRYQQANRKNIVNPVDKSDAAWIHVIDPNDNIKPGAHWYLVDRGTIFHPASMPGAHKPRIPNYDSFYYETPENSLFWMFGVVMNEIWHIDHPNVNMTIGVSGPFDNLGVQSDPFHAEKEKAWGAFRKLAYGMLMTNWENRINNANNLDDRLVLLGAAALWNKNHASTFIGGFDATMTVGPMPEVLEPIVSDAAQGYCGWYWYVEPTHDHMQFNANYDNPIGATVCESNNCIYIDSEGHYICPTRPADGRNFSVSHQDLTWTKYYSFVEFMLTAEYDQWPFKSVGLPQQSHRAIEGFFLNCGPALTGAGTQRGAVKVAAANAAKAGTVKKVAWTAGITTAVAAGALFWYAHAHHIAFQAAARTWSGRIVDAVKPSNVKRSARRLFAHENPISTPTTRGKTVAYRAHLGHTDRTRFRSDGHVDLFRSGQHVATFVPLPHQLRKIRAGRGVLLIFTDQLVA